MHLLIFLLILYKYLSHILWVFETNGRCTTVLYSVALYDWTPREFKAR